MVVGVLALAITALLVWEWSSERRNKRARALLKEEERVHVQALQLEAKLPFEEVEQAAQRLILDMDREREAAARADERWKAYARSLLSDVTELRKTVTRLEWLLSLCSYDPITGYLDDHGPTAGSELQKKLGDHQTAAAFQARLFDGVKLGLYRVADSNGERVYWLDPKRPAVTLASDEDATDGEVILGANALVDQMENGWSALPTGGR
jgi:hypothetical protein